MRALRQGGRLAAPSLGRKGDLLDLASSFDVSGQGCLRLRCSGGQLRQSRQPRLAYVMLHHTFGYVMRT
jgi:hypothetical protein